MTPRPDSRPLPDASPPAARAGNEGAAASPDAAGPADAAGAARPAAKKAVKKATAKKTAAKKAPAKTTAAAKKTAAKKTAKDTAEKTAAKAAAKTTKKATVKKTAAEKTAAKKTAVKKTAAKKAPARKAAGKAPGPVAVRQTEPLKDHAPNWPDARTPAPAAAPAAAGPADGTGTAPALDPGERQRLLHGTHHDPHTVLGAHRVGDGLLLRTLRPYARAVTVLVEGMRAELHDDGDGLFSGVLPLTVRDALPAYRLLVRYGEAPGEDEIETEDPYRFLPTIGELDLHLIGEGRHEELWRALGARPMTVDGVPGTRFTVWAPNALGVRVAGDFNYWDGTVFPMRSLGGSGVWEVFLPGVGPGALYKFDITRPDGTHTLRADPMARRTEKPPATASVVEESEYVWQDAQWLARRAELAPHRAPVSVYEVHLPSWRPGLTYRELAEQLPAYVKELGFTHVELMPVAEHPFGGSWGYQVTGFYAPTARMGTPDDFRYLVDRLHQEGIGVLMDWVPAHFPKDEWALARFDGTALYEHSDPARAEHPDWGTLEFNFGRTEVRNFLVANAVYWCEEFHIDGLRVDAVASMLYLDYSRESGQWTPNVYGGRENLEAVSFLQEMNATVYRRCPGVITAAEESTAWDGVTRATHHTGPGGFGGLGFGFKWNMGWMHDSLEYMAKEPVHRKYHHNEMTFSMVYAYSENYILPISHDEVVHGKGSLVSKMPGDWWQQRAGHRAYLGFMWSHPGKQLLFMGQEFAQGAEWSEVHGPDWWLLDPAYSAAGDHQGVRELVRDLNHVYTATPALWERDTEPAGFSWIEGNAAEDNVFAFLRYAADGTPLVAVSNFSPVVRTDYRIGVPAEVPAWREILNTDAARYGGSGVGNPEPLKTDASAPAHGRPAGIAPTLPPLATIWLVPA
ncbi:1,4-alpha-glucan branching enzyme [Streptomyces sp. TRM 70361]|uniref:1,4-alpha-glucan branching enzyme n=1 Tax=Streptomyces sp. TRM 70361 TaxID=3116553 RepID=UPI002E7BB2DA|nr:1,4-alpha-glucan branching enzyme [Streptomyces sp. TRM 70361]MEE1938707.1 1,4-alpha-glucan branching enzyme [Streptomyces sp. TRM 70361]